MTKRLIDFKDFDRTAGIGASEVAAVAGVNPWRTPLDVWLAKTKQVPGFEGNDDTAWGSMVEPTILRWYEGKEKENGFDGEIKPNQKTVLFGPVYFATPDAYRLVKGKVERVVQVKNVGARAAKNWDGEPGSDDIPLYVNAQVQWEMDSADVGLADVVASLGGTPPVMFTVRRDDGVLKVLRERVDTFWEYVRSGTPPPLTGEESKEAISKLYPQHSVELRTLTVEDDAYALVQAFRTAYVLSKKAGKDADQLAVLVRAAIGADAGIIGDFGKVYWKRTKDAPHFDVKGAWPSLRQDAEALAGSTDQVLAMIGQRMLTNMSEVVERCTSIKPGVRVLRPYFVGAPDDQE